MSREEMEKLLGGYATDTLGDAERRALFEAALNDQELFDTLAKEQALRDVLEDSFSRQQLLEALRPARAPRGWRAWQWLPLPASMAIAGGLAALVIGAGWLFHRGGTPARQEALVAQVQSPATPVKPFEPPLYPQSRKDEISLPAPPALKQSRKVKTALLPAAVPAPPLPRAKAVDSLEAASATTAALARQMYVEPDTSVKAPAPAALARTRVVRTDAAVTTGSLGAEYSLLLKRSDGEYAPVSPDAEFHTGDSIRLRLVANQDGYLYLFQHRSTGGWSFVDGQPVEQGQTCQLPRSGALQFEEPGQKDFLVVRSSRGEPSLAGLDSPELGALAGGAAAASLQPRAGLQRTALKISLQVR